MQLDQAALEQAVLLAKTDLTTELVQEFTELQGIVGGLYARAQGLGEAVAQAIYSQYIPASVEDPIPATVEGQILGLADRMMTIAEMFAIGLAAQWIQRPVRASPRRQRSGQNPCRVGPAPYRRGTRVHGHGSIARARSQRDPVRWQCFSRSVSTSTSAKCGGYAYDVVNAVLSTGLTTVTDAVARAQALTQVRGSDDLVAISTAFKRIKNILRQADEKQDTLRKHRLPAKISPRPPSNTCTRRAPGCAPGGGPSRPAGISAGPRTYRDSPPGDRQLF